MIALILMELATEVDLENLSWTRRRPDLDSAQCDTLGRYVSETNSTFNNKINIITERDKCTRARAT
jgi:hypothetical protein